MISIVIGRNDRARLRRRVAEDVLDVERDEEEDAEHRERDEHRHEVRARERADPEEREVEHRQPLPLLEHDERDEKDGRGGEEAEDLGRAPAVAVPLDQRVAEREEEADRGDETGKVDALLVRGVARLADRERETTMPTTPTGTLMKKIQFQFRFSTIRPPTSGPIASASAETPAQIPIAWPRCFGGKVATMMESEAGFISAAPTPWTARAPIRKPAVEARPQASEEA